MSHDGWRFVMSFMVKDLGNLILGMEYVLRSSSEERLTKYMSMI